MVETRTTEQVLREIEEDLRQDGQHLKTMERDLRSLGVRRPPRISRVIAIVVGALVLVAGSFSLGWYLSPGPEPTPTSAVVQPFDAEMLFTQARESFTPPAWYGIHAPTAPFE